ncbi:MAG: hypothetical protein AAF399_01230 [Bacteroidota bacterium]
MKLRLWLFVLIAGLSLPAQAQEMDVTKLIANTKTFIFDNNKNTVKGYIYAELEEVTACCGSDRIYLEVNIDPSGYVKKVNALTGKNECFKQAAADIVKNVKWDAKDFKGPKSIYFEIKPDVDCSEGRNNKYAEVEIFNNPLANPDGVAAAPSGQPTTPPATTPPATSEPATTPPATSEPTASNDQPVAQPTRSQPASPRTSAPGAPAPRPQAEKPEETVVLPSGYPQPGAPTSADKEVEAARKRAEANRTAQIQEIQDLKDQMAQLREKAANQAKEDAARQKAAADKEKRRQAYIAKRKEQQRRREDARRNQQGQGRDRSLNNEEAYADADDGVAGGLFLDEEVPDGEFGEDSDTEGMSEEDKIRMEMQEMEQLIQEKEQAQQEREAEAQRIADENLRANEELFRMYEDMSLKAEEAEQARENQELASLEQERIRVEEERRKQEEQYQQMMDEIQRLQEEAERSISDLELQKRDIERQEEIQKTREQEIILEQALREQERLRLLKDKERYLLGRSTIRPPSNRDLIASEEDQLDAMIASLDVTAEADSEQVKLIQIINQLRTELQLVRYKLQKLEGEGGGAGPELVNGTPSGPETVNGTPSGGTNVASATPSGGKTIRPAKGFKTADQDDSWKNLSNSDIVDPTQKVSDYIPARPTPTPKPSVIEAPVPQGDRSIPTQDAGTATTTPTTKEKDPNDHSGTFWDGPGPKFEARTYVEGEGQMKELIKEKLRAGGVCGLGQAAFSLTLDPKGNVVRYSVLAANSSTVEFQLGTVLSTLKFNAVDSRYNQTIYQEFKAEIICDGAADKVRLQEVEDIIKD